MDAPIGQSVPRVDGIAKLTGAAKYAADVALPGRLWGKVLRSPFPHARIVRLDARAARAVPGVHLVLTAQDVPPLLIGRRTRDQPLLCGDRVRFVGDKIAAVAAEDPGVAQTALDLIEVEYEELPAIFDPVAALEPGALLVHERPSDYRGRPADLPDLPNLQSHSRWEVGDVARGFAESDRVFEQTFQTQRVHQLYLEPHVCTMAVAQDGSIQVWSSNKQPYTVRGWLAEVAGLAAERVTVHPVHIGGDFGGKGDHWNVHLCYFLARATGQPVTMLYSYVDELMASNPRHPSTITLKTGIKRGGRLWARQARIIFDGGAYAAFKPNLHLGGADKSGGPYLIPNTRIEAFIAYTNTVHGGHYRGPGSVQALFAVESHMDFIAHELALDPLEFRLMNAMRSGKVAPDSKRWEHVLLAETLQRAREATGWREPKPEPSTTRTSTGRGIAAGYHHIGNGESGTAIHVNADGSVEAFTCVPDTGTGSHTIFQQIVAGTLARPLGAVRIRQAPTGLVPRDSGVGASRVTNVAGRATLNAAQQMLKTLIDIAAGYLECQADEVDYRDGCFFDRSHPDASMSWDDLAGRAAAARGGPVEVIALYEAKGPRPEKSFVVQVAEVEVDRETGQVQVLRLATVDEVGLVLHPLNATGQLEGGVAQGLGFALMEEIVVQDGRPTTLGLHDYKVPTIADMPPLTNVLITEGEGSGPFKTKALSELTISSVAPAIANAVYDAVGVRILDLPITAEKVHSALREAEAKGQP